MCLLLNVCCVVIWCCCFGVLMVTGQQHFHIQKVNLIVLFFFFALCVWFGLGSCATSAQRRNSSVFLYGRAATLNKWMRLLGWKIKIEIWGKSWWWEWQQWLQQQGLCTKMTTGGATKWTTFNLLLWEGFFARELKMKLQLKIVVT